MTSKHYSLSNIKLTSYDRKRMNSLPRKTVIVHFKKVSLKPGCVWQLMMNMNRVLDPWWHFKL